VKRSLWAWRRLLTIGALAAVLAAVFAGAAIGLSGDDIAPYQPGAAPLKLDEQQEEELLEQDLAFVTSRTAGDNPLDQTKVGQLNAKARKAAKQLAKNPAPSGPTTFDSAWTTLGPNPIAQVQRSSNTFAAVAGRIGALVIRPSNHQFILGAAQGGVWTYDPAGTGTWTPRTDDQDSLAIGALAIAPSNDAIVYAGTGEGALSGDSMFGDGILKSTDGGVQWSHVSGDYFQGVSVSRLAVDPVNPNHLYAAILRGRGGARRTTPAVHSRYGVWESTDGGANWTLLKEAKQEANGATDIEIDPLTPTTLYASFWGDAIYKSTDAGKSWSPIMNGFPAGANYADPQTRFSIAISHPSASAPAVLYTGFDYDNANGEHQAARVWKSTDAGAHWNVLPTGTGINSVLDYCGTQCFYDNVIEVDPTDPNVVFAGGSFGYTLSPPSGGIFRSTDGGQTWVNLGWDQHPDFHALAFDPTNTKHVLIGSDGGVWFSTNRGGRPGGTTDPLNAVDWTDLNGNVAPNSATVSRNGLRIAQFTSIATAPQVPPGTESERFWGGTQDNGTLRKSVNSNTWFDTSSGDGGQAIVDWTSDSCALGPSCYVYGTFFGVSPFRFTDGGGTFTNQYIRNGLNTSDRSDFYPPFVPNRLDNNQLFFGTYRLYRTDNARAASAGAVTWKAISPDLTTGCTGIAPNGARNCTISAVGVGGGEGVYTGSLDGLVYFSPDAQVSDAPTWIQSDAKGKTLPNRPVAQIAVDASNDRIAYLAYDGFSGATPKNPGHVFKTTDAGQSWQDISGDLPDTSVNSLVLDPSYPNTLYAGTDAGAFVTYNGGGHWQQLGSGMPNVGIWQLDLDPFHRIMAAGTHGRGAFRLADGSTAVPSLVLSKVDAGIPVGPDIDVDYSITLRNFGNADATGVTISDPLPGNTTFVRADHGGAFASGVVTWSNLSVPTGVPGTGGSVTVHLTVKIDPSLKGKVDSIVNDGLKATSAQGPSTTGSAFVTPIAPKYAVALAPATQLEAAHAGASVNYHVTVTNTGFTADSYKLAATGAYAATVLDTTCTTPLATTASVAPGDSTDVCVKVTVPASATDGTQNTTTVTATSVASPSVSGSAALVTQAVTKDWLLVDEDGNNPDVQKYYTDALNTAIGSTAYTVWDLAANNNQLPLSFLLAYKHVVWFTGSSYPGPLLPYESELKTFLDGGGHLFMSGQDILDQAAGTTAFVHDYLHVTWDGTEAQNDKSTATVTGVAGNPVTNGIGTVPLDQTVLTDAFKGFMDEITPNGTAQGAFTTDRSTATAPVYDALTYSGTYKVIFLAFPAEEYGTATQKADLFTRLKTFFGA
jgi:photosystem II stability/assembly factor-like uncharacterized protein